MRCRNLSRPSWRKNTKPSAPHIHRPHQIQQHSCYPMSVSNNSPIAAQAAPRLLEYYDPLLHLGTRTVDWSRHEKALRGRLGAERWTPQQLALLATLRASQTYWIDSSQKAVVGQEDLDRLSTLAAMMLSLSGVTEQGGPLPHFSAEWTSPLSVVQSPQGGLVKSLVGFASAAATAAVTGAAAAAFSAASGATPAEVLKRGFTAATTGAPQPQPEGDGMSPAAVRSMWKAEFLQQEAAMWCFAHAVAVRQAGLQRFLGYVRDTNSGSSTSTGGAPIPAGGDQLAASTAAVQLLRQAAGLLDHYSHAVLPIVDAVTSVADAAGRGRRNLAAELQRNVLNGLGLICLAEAQAITTARAIDKGSSPLVVAGLEAGTGQLYLMARMALCGATVPQVSGAMAALPQTYSPPATAVPLLNGVKRLATYAAAAQALHYSRSRAAQAQHWEAAGELGIAQSAANEAEAAAKSGLKACRDAGNGVSESSWITCLESQLAGVSGQAARYEKDRLQISYQPLPREPPEAAAPKVLVSAIPTQPPSYVPPEPEPGQEQQGQGCTVQ